MIIQLNDDFPSPYRIQRLAKLLEDGAVIAIPPILLCSICLSHKKSAVEQLVKEN